MRVIFVVVITFFFTDLSGQNNYVGKYCDLFGSSFEIHPDSTFNYSVDFDLIHKWAKGTWKVSSDTIYFTFVPVYDTLLYHDSLNNIDTLILSEDKHSETITQKEIYNFSLSGQLYQDSCTLPEKCFYRNNRLININSFGKLNRKKAKHPMIQNQKSHTWFIRKVK